MRRGQAAAWLRRLVPSRDTVRRDAVAGLPDAIGCVPDGMAASVLVGVNPVHGLYAGFAGRIAGGATASSQLMVVTTTSAAALAAGSALRGVDAADRTGALFLLTALAGAAMVAAGVLRLGRYVRFVPHSVMIGFLTGIAANIACSQLGDLTGVDATGPNAVAKALDVVLHPRAIDLPSLLVGLSALGLAAVLSLTPLRPGAALVALVVPSVAAAVLSLGVVLVQDAGGFPRGLPVPALPHLRYLSLDLVTGALAVAVLVLVQGAGVSESAPNPDGSLSDANRDFVAQGVGNVASSAFLGQPVGGSVGQTALNVASGARSRWAGIFSGVWVMAILAALSGVVGKVALPTLAALLVYAAVRSIRPGEIRAILRTSPTSMVALVATFVATLFLPVAQAVAIGVTISLLLQLNQEAVDLRVVELVPLPDGTLREQPAPEVLPSQAVTVLDVYGSLLYAGARTLQARLPEVGEADRPVVVLRLRGRTSLGTTFFTIAAAYARRIATRHGRLYVSGVDPALLHQMERNGRVKADDHVLLFEAADVVGASTLDAVAHARRWLAGPNDDGPTGG